MDTDLMIEIVDYLKSDESEEAKRLTLEINRCQLGELRDRYRFVKERILELNLHLLGAIEELRKYSIDRANAINSVDENEDDIFGETQKNIIKSIQIPFHQLDVMNRKFEMLKIIIKGDI